MTSDQVKQIKVRPNPSRYAEEIMIINTIKSEKVGDDIKRQGFVRMTFIDTVSGQSVADITISEITARALKKILTANLEKLDKDLKSKSPVPPKIEPQNTTSYIG